MSIDASRAGAHTREQAGEQQGAAAQAGEVKPLLSPESLAKIDREIAKYPPEGRQSAVMGALRIAQVENGWVSPAVIDAVAQKIGIAPIAVWEVASFYNMYDTKPVGRVKIGICTCLPCALRDGAKAGEYLKEKLGIDYGETTKDGQFTLVETECQGACGDAPVCLINNHRQESFLDNGRIDALLNELGSSKS